MAAQVTHPNSKTTCATCACLPIDRKAAPHPPGIRGIRAWGLPRNPYFTAVPVFIMVFLESYPAELSGFASWQGRHVTWGYMRFLGLIGWKAQLRRAGLWYYPSNSPHALIHFICIYEDTTTNSSNSLCKPTTNTGLKSQRYRHL